MRMQGFSDLSVASGGTLPNAFRAAYVGPAPDGEAFIGPILTTRFIDGTGPVATYGDLRDGVRYGWPLMFALGWAGSYVAWRWWWQKTGKLNLGGKGYFSGVREDAWSQMGFDTMYRVTYTDAHGAEVTRFEDTIGDARKAVSKAIREGGHNFKVKERYAPPKRIDGLAGTPEQHRETFDTLIGTANDLVRRGHLKNAHDYVTRAYQEARWFKMNAPQASNYRRLFAQTTKR